jgi:hypothetical protein
MALHSEITSLHRYFIWADRMRVLALDLLGKDHGNAADLLFLHPYFCYWYAGSYVVIEGWRKLELHDTVIDDLLSVNVYVEALRLHRNGAYHFQPTYFAEKVIGFVSEPGSAEWIHKLRRAFSAWFLAYFEAQEGTGK